MVDGRRSQWVPVPVDSWAGPRGESLEAEFGRGGPDTWVRYLAACKTSINQGEIDYLGEDDGWLKLGYRDDRPDFTLADFFAKTGRMHLTRTTKVGGFTRVICTVWGDLVAGRQRLRHDGSTSDPRASDGTSTSSSREVDEPETPRSQAQITGGILAPYSESESESERERESVRLPMIEIKSAIKETYPTSTGGPAYFLREAQRAIIINEMLDAGITAADIRAGDTGWETRLKVTDDELLDNQRNGETA